MSQPQAPIAWGETRLMRQVTAPYRWGEVFCQGDTIALMSRYIRNNQNYAAVSLTGDNGQHWSPWYHFYGPDYQTSTGIVSGVTSTAIFCNAPTEGYLRGLYRTTDLGETWQRPLDSLPALYIECQRRDTLFGWARFTLDGPPGVIWTNDLGHTFSPHRELAWEISIGEMAASATTLHAIGNGMGDSSTYLLRYARAPLLEGPFEPTRILNPDAVCVTQSRIACDDSGTVMILSAVDYEGVLNSCALWLNVSHDDGVTWSPPDTLTPTQSASFLGLQIARHGRHWLFCWRDSTASPGFPDGGNWCRFSANNGRSWYPNQQVEGTGWFSGEIDGVYLGSDRAMVHVACGYFQQVWGHYYLQWEGQITADGLPPLLEGTLLPDLVASDDTVALTASGFDNDSLWLMQAVFKRRWGATDSVVMDLSSNAVGGFDGTWITPADTGQWAYYYRAEDMWENVSVFPEGEPGIVHVGAITALDSAFIVPRSSFIVSSFPNPFNSTTQIRYTLPSPQHVTLKVFDLLGREVAVLASAVQPAGEHTLSWHAKDLSSGLYFLRLQAGVEMQTLKVMVLR